MKQEEVASTSRIEDLARQRLRSLRLARGWTLDDLAKRANMSPSTISRIETGHRRLAIDNLASIAKALETTVDEVLADHHEEEVIIRPVRSTHNGVTVWPLNRVHDTNGPVVAKMRIPASKSRMPDQKVHPGRDWLFVLDGTARVVLGDREFLVHVGEAAEFNTMTPHWIAGYGKAVEVLMIFDHNGERAHVSGS